LQRSFSCHEAALRNRGPGIAIELPDFPLKMH
jgi:hypothetical protein